MAKNDQFLHQIFIEIGPKEQFSYQFSLEFVRNHQKDNFFLPIFIGIGKKWSEGPNFHISFHWNWSKMVKKWLIFIAILIGIGQKWSIFDYYWIIIRIMDESSWWITFAWVARFSRYFNETVVEGEVVANRVLPGGEPVAVVRETVHDELADAAQRQLLLRWRQNGHRYQSDVRIRRFH